MHQLPPAGLQAQVPTLLEKMIAMNKTAAAQAQ